MLNLDFRTGHYLHSRLAWYDYRQLQGGPYDPRRYCTNVDHIRAEVTRSTLSDDTRQPCLLRSVSSCLSLLIS